MFRKLALAAFLALVATPALAQNPTCPTRPIGDNTNACASTAFVQQSLGATALTVGATPITGGTNGGLLFINSGVLGSLSGTANQVLANFTAGAGPFIGFTMPSCPDSGGNHLNYVNGTGITCGTSGGAGSAITQLVGDVTGTGPGVTTTVVARINGNPLGSTTPTAANILIANGAGWNSTAVSGEATITGGGVVTISRTFSPSMTGNWQFNPTTGVAVTINSAGGTARGLVINSLSSGAVSQTVLNNITVTDQNSANASTAIALLSSTYLAGASASAGNGIGLQGIAGTAANTNVFYGFGVQALCQATNTATGPTGFGGAGQCAGANLNGQLLAGATNYAAVFAAEVNTTVVAALAGSPPRFKAAFAIGHNLNDAVRGSIADAAISISSHSATNVGWGYGILFSDIMGNKAFDTTSRLIGAAIFNATTTVVNSFIDFAAFTCSGGTAINFGASVYQMDCLGNSFIGASSVYGWAGLSRFLSPGNGVVALANNTVSDAAVRLQFAGTGATFGSLARRTVGSPTLSFRTADDGADSGMTASTGVFSGNVNVATLQAGNITPAGNNIIQVAIASATARFIDVQSNTGTSTREALYGVDAGGGVYAWCVTCTSTIFGTQTNIPVDFYANNIKVMSIQPAVTLAGTFLQIVSTQTSTSTLTGAVIIDPSGTARGGLGVSGAIYAGAEITTGVVATASLPACNAGRKGSRHFVNDSNAAFTAGIGAVVAGGGANNVPVTCDGTNWRIGANDNQARPRSLAA